MEPEPKENDPKGPEDFPIFAELRELRKEHDTHQQFDPDCPFCDGTFT